MLSIVSGHTKCLVNDAPVNEGNNKYMYKRMAQDIRHLGFGLFGYWMEIIVYSIVEIPAD